MEEQIRLASIGVHQVYGIVGQHGFLPFPGDDAFNHGIHGMKPIQPKQNRHHEHDEEETETQCQPERSGHSFLHLFFHCASNMDTSLPGCERKKALRRRFKVWFPGRMLPEGGEAANGGWA
ncbi:MAG: hypothetical protein IPG33_03600 [Betaproteobacteria bacterium]|nr:hypothetical protein [Betaproteobacteria bacterium]